MQRPKSHLLVWGDRTTDRNQKVATSTPGIGAPAPEVRLRDGRTFFLPGRIRDELAEALDRAGVPLLQRPPVRPCLLEPLLDRDYRLVREAVERQLAGWGFARVEVRRIRRWVSVPMVVLLGVDLGVDRLDQSGRLVARFLVHVSPEVAIGSSYRRFRRWTDAITDRPTSRRGSGGQ